MSEVAVQDVSMSSGHDDCPSVVAVEGDSTVLVNGHPVVTLGDHFAPHSCGEHSTHQGETVSGSGIVFVNGKPVCRVGDNIGGECDPNIIITGDSTMMINS